MLPAPSVPIRRPLRRVKSHVPIFMRTDIRSRRNLVHPPLPGESIHRILWPRMDLTPKSAFRVALSCRRVRLMKTHRTWHGIRMRRTLAAADPDSPPRPVTLPAAWDDTSAAALAALVPGAAPVILAHAAAAWIEPVAARARGLETPPQSLALDFPAPTRAMDLPAPTRAMDLPAPTRAMPMDSPLADRLYQLLMLRRGTATETLWRGRCAERPGFVLNLPAFLDSSGLFDAAA